jgi:hypothetical protein
LQTPSSKVATDYGKIRRLFHLGKSEYRQVILENLIETGSVEGFLTEQFSNEINKLALISPIKAMANCPY